MTEEGGKCPWCQAEDKWETVNEDRQASHVDRLGVWLEWHETINVRCMNIVPFDDEPGEAVCGCEKTIERDCEKEYEDSDS